jgi:hypothetical protein
MKKVGWSLTNNGKPDSEYKEYDKTTYQCVDDDVWVTVEAPTGSK